MSTSIPPFGLNIMASVSANSGLGHSTREFVRALLSRGTPVRILEFDAGHGRSQFDNSFKYLCVDSAESLPYAINLFIIDPLSMRDLALYPPKGLNVKGRFNVAFVWWELTDMPASWFEAARLYDVLIAGSPFVHATLACHVPGVPVLLAPHPIQMPDEIPANRPRFGLPDGVFLVYMGFEPHSDPARKNPFSAIAAYKTAFAGRADCHLVIKVNNPNVEGLHRQLLQEMYALTQDDPRIHVIQNSLPYNELLSLYASCDAFISLHRSEGMGLIPLEAMRLGKPVVATGWSGNMSYMNHRSACLVNFDFRPTDDSSDMYGPTNLGINSFWADPDIRHAAAWLKKLADDPAFRAELGRHAATDAARYQEEAKRVEFVDELEAIWKCRDLLPSQDRQALLRRVRELSEQEQLRKLGPVQRLMRNAQRNIKHQIDRRLTWRFRKDNRP